MKRGILLTSLALLLFLPIKAPAQADVGPRRYRIESGRVEYSLTGSQVGTETVDFDRWGIREVRHVKAELTVGGKRREIEQLTILDGEWMYHIDLITGIGTRMPESMLRELLERSDATDMVEVSENSMREMGGVKSGTEEVAGRSCDVWTIEKMHTKNWLWKGLSLKMTTDMAGVRTESIALRIEEGKPIPPERLLVPDNVEITDDPNDPHAGELGEPEAKKAQTPGASEQESSE